MAGILTSKRTLITQTETAKRLMISRETLLRYIKEGKLNRYEGSKIDEDELREYVKRNKPANAPVLSREKARHEKYKADLAELELKRRRGDLLEVEEIKKDWCRMVTACKSRLLAIPAKVSPQLPGCENAREMERMIKQHINQALEELSNESSDSATNDLERNDQAVGATI
jgi:phage terminase Nu1 subunit (DNA packaging protein)|tara:strand:+ start:55 stop:567 length:513 start_codon:yes stop_codon:yes gene_type:complete